MTYKEALSFLYNQLPFYQRIGKSAYKANLDNTLALDGHFDHPHRYFKTIHVAGTNGKGSVSYILAAIYKKLGFKVGLYTSPHLLDFRERITVNFEMIPKATVTAFVHDHFDFFARLQPSFFEITVAMAFEYFKQQEVDIAIIETGLGGRLDSTNIINPLASVITNIGLDHTTFLGDSLPEIAREKAGIIKPNTPVIIGKHQPEISNIFIDTATHFNAPIYFAEDYYQCQNEELFAIQQIKHHKSFELDCNLQGNYQAENMVTALTVTDILGLSEQVFKLQKLQVPLRGRWEIISHHPLTICDTGHNTDGITEVLKNLQNTRYQKLHFVFGMVNDKDIDSITDMLPQHASYYVTKADIPRALDEKELYENMVGKGLWCSKYISVKDAYHHAIKQASKEDLILIGGSTFIVADLLAYLQNKSMLSDENYQK